jgi:hypothetical protein
MGKRQVPVEDVARFWQARASGLTIKESSKVAGINYNTGQRWDAQKRKAVAEAKIAEFDEVQAKAKDYNRTALKIVQEVEDGLPPVIPAARLSPRAKKGLEDFDYFRRVYLGRVPSPWQVEAAYKIVQYLESQEKEHLVLNCPPGAGKSTLFHDVAVWAIVRNRGIRVLIGSNTEKLAKQYSRRIRETLERSYPLKPDPELVKKGMALNAEGCLATDYGRFKPAAAGSMWRAEEFIVEQLDIGGLDNKEPTVAAYGIDSEFIGHRADLCLYDDVATTENAKDSASRDKLIERWDSMAEARVDPGGLLVVIGQRLSSNDLYAHCLAKYTYDDLDEDGYDGSDVTDVSKRAEREPTKHQKYHHIVYKAYYEELDTGPESRRKDALAWPEGPLLDPFRLSWKDLSYIRHSNPNKFRVVYQQEDIDIEEALIDRVHAVGGVGKDGVEYPGCIDRGRRPGHIPQYLHPPIISVASVDPSAQNFWGVEWWLFQPETNLRYLIDLERPKMTAEELLGYDVASGKYSGIMEEWQNRSVDLGYPITHWIIEINAAQRYLLAHDFVRRWQALHQVNVVPHTTSRNKLDESLGVEALLPPLWRSGSIRLPTMVENWKTMALVDEMCTWTRDKKRGTDLVMAHWFAELHLPQLRPLKAPPRQWRPTWLAV